MAFPRERIPVSSATLLGALGSTDRCRADDPINARLRSELSAFLQVPHVFLTGSAREGIYWLLAEAVRERGPGECLMWHYNFFAVPKMAERAGLQPVYLDAAETHGEPTLAEARARLTPRTRAILVSHHFGRPSSLATWRQFAREHDLALVEDCAHAFGARVEVDAGQASVGTADMGGVFSLSLTKTLTGVAGGVVITRRDDIAERLRQREAELPPSTPAAVRRAIVSALAGKVFLNRLSYSTLVHGFNRLARVAGLDPLEAVMGETPSAQPPVVGPDVERAQRPPTTAQRLSPAYARIALAHLPRVTDEIRARRLTAQAIIEARDWQRLRFPPWETDRYATHLNFVVRTDRPERLRRCLLAAGFDSRHDYIRPMTGDAYEYPVSTGLTPSGIYLPIRHVRDARSRERLVAALARFDGAGERA